MRLYLSGCALLSFEEEVEEEGEEELLFFLLPFFLRLLVETRLQPSSFGASLILGDGDGFCGGEGMKGTAFGFNFLDEEEEEEEVEEEEEEEEDEEETESIEAVLSPL